MHTAARASTLRGMLTAALLVASLLGQTIYVWTDAQGEDHYTDDPTSIPKGVKARTTEGQPVDMISTKPSTPEPPDAGAPKKAPRTEVDTCELGRKGVASAELRLEKAKAEKPAEDRAARCQSVLNTMGRGAWAQCMAAGGDDTAAWKKKVEAAERDVENAREFLRKAQTAGCR